MPVRPRSRLARSDGDRRAALVSSARECKQRGLLLAGGGGGGVRRWQVPDSQAGTRATPGWQLDAIQVTQSLPLAAPVTRNCQPRGRGSRAYCDAAWSGSGDSDAARLDVTPALSRRRAVSVRKAAPLLRPCGPSRPRRRRAWVTSGRGHGRRLGARRLRDGRNTVT